MADESRAESKKHPNEVDREIGRRIKTRRNDLGMNQQGLAERIGVSYQQVQKYENGTDRVGASRLFAIANALGCQIADFFDPIDRRAEGAGGGPNYETTLQANRVLATEEGRLLVQAFLAINDLAVRRKLAELAEAMSGSTRRAASVRRVRRPVMRG